MTTSSQPTQNSQGEVTWNPSVGLYYKPASPKREGFGGVIGALQDQIKSSGNTVKSYPKNFSGIISAIQDLTLGVPIVTTTSDPPEVNNPLTGQLWYDKQENNLFIFAGDYENAEGDIGPDIDGVPVWVLLADVDGNFLQTTATLPLSLDSSTFASEPKTILPPLVEANYNVQKDYNIYVNDALLALEDAIENIDDAQVQVTYQIQTDKILRASDPAIELVDSAGFYSNVKFSGTGGLGVTSDFNGIIIDGTSIDSRSKNNEDRIELIELRNPVKDTTFTVENRNGVATIRDGEMSVDAQQTADINFISMGPNSIEGITIPVAAVGDTLLMTKKSDGTRHQFKITGGGAGLYGVEQVDNVNATITLVDYNLEIIPVATLQVRIREAVTASTDYATLKAALLAAL